MNRGILAILLYALISSPAYAQDPCTTILHIIESELKSGENILLKAVSSTEVSIAITNQSVITHKLQDGQWAFAGAFSGYSFGPLNGKIVSSWNSSQTRFVGILSVNGDPKIVSVNFQRGFKYFNVPLSGSSFSRIIWGKKGIFAAAVAPAPWYRRSSQSIIFDATGLSPGSRSFRGSDADTQNQLDELEVEYLVEHQGFLAHFPETAL